MHRFLLLETLQVNSEVTLSNEESHHLVKVVRIREGEAIELVNGKGEVATARVIEASARACRVLLNDVRREGLRPCVNVAFGIPKGAAFEFIVRRCTEVGVASLQPLVTHYSLRPQSFNDARWHKVVVEVCKQCEEPYFPQLCDPLSLDAWLAKRDKSRPLLFCHENERETQESLLTGEGGLDLLIGSEGGWANEETEKLLDYGVFPFGLGKNRLRAETATLVALTLVKSKIGEL